MFLNFPKLLLNFLPLFHSSWMSEILAKSWTAAAAGYNAQFVPRFAPWTADALAALKEHVPSLPTGAV